MSAAINRLLLRAWCACPSFGFTVEGGQMKAPDTTNAVPSAPNSANFIGSAPVAATPARSHTQRPWAIAAVRCSGTVCAGASHTTSEAADLPEWRVFSRPKFKVLDVGSAYPQGRRQRF